MDFGETLLIKLMTEDPNKLSDKELQIASLFELRSMKKELISLNEKIERTAEESRINAQAIDTKYDKRFIELEARVKLNEESRLERTVLQKVFAQVPTGITVLATAFVIYDYIKSHIGH